MNRALLVQRHASIEGAICAEKIQRRLAIITLAGAVDVCLRKDENARATLVPLKLDLVTLEKGLLRDGGVELRDIEDSDRGGLALYIQC